MKLLISQKDQLFDLIEKIGLSPSQFEFEESISRLGAKQKATTLILKNSDYFFSFESDPNSPSSHFAILCPGSDSHTERTKTRHWNWQINIFSTWLRDLKKEINSPNKWDRLTTEISRIGIVIENDDDKFTVQEYEDLKERMIILKKGTSSIGLLEEQVTTINTKLDHLTELAKEMNKFDWKGLFIGTVISIVIQLGISVENAESLWTLIKQVFNNYLLP